MAASRVWVASSSNSPFWSAVVRSFDAASNRQGRRQKAAGRMKRARRSADFPICCIADLQSASRAAVADGTSVRGRKRIENPRYGRLQVCATLVGVLLSNVVFMVAILQETGW